MQTHRARHAAPARRLSGHVAAIADMRPTSGLIRLDVIGADDLAVMFGHIATARLPDPQVQRALACQAGIDRIGFACADHTAQDRPERILVAVAHRADHQIVAICHRRLLPGGCPVTTISGDRQRASRAGPGAAPAGPGRVPLSRAPRTPTLWRARRSCRHSKARHSQGYWAYGFASRRYRRPSP